MTTKSEQSASAAEPSVDAPPAGEAGPAALPSIIIAPSMLASGDAGIELLATTAAAEATPEAAPEVQSDQAAQTASAAMSGTGAEAASESPAQDTHADAAPTAQTSPGALQSADGHAAADAPTAPATAPESAPTDGDAQPGARGHGTDAFELSAVEAERFAASYRASWEPGEPLDAPMPVPAQPIAASTSTTGARSSGARPWQCAEGVLSARAPQPRNPGLEFR